MVRPGWTLRVQTQAPFRLHWSADEWRSVAELPSSGIAAAGIDFVDLPVPADQEAPFRFTFFWTEPGRWEGQDFTVAVGAEFNAEPLRVNPRTD